MNNFGVVYGFGIDTFTNYSSYGANMYLIPIIVPNTPNNINNIYSGYSSLFLQDRNMNTFAIGPNYDFFPNYLDGIDRGLTGVLGTGDTNDAIYPVLINNLSNITYISSSYNIFNIFRVNLK
jgi:hypothetical protein